MGITLKEASEKVGVTRQTLMKAIKTGRISADKSDSGEWRVEPVELFRVWPPVKGLHATIQPELTTGDTPGLQVEIDHLRELLRRADQRAEEWKGRAERAEETMARFITDQRPTPQPGFWGRLFGRGASQ